MAKNRYEAIVSKGRYEIIVRTGRKIMQRQLFNSYDEAMLMLDFIEENIHKMYSTQATVEFKDNIYFQIKKERDAA